MIAVIQQSYEGIPVSLSNLFDCLEKIEKMLVIEGNIPEKKFEVYPDVFPVLLENIPPEKREKVKTFLEII